MTQRIFHGDITPDDLATALEGEFNRGDLRVTRSGGGDEAVVNIHTPSRRSSGGSTALSMTIQKHEDGVLVALGDQEWLGVAASLGQTALSVFQNPMNILGRLDDVAADVDSLKLPEKVWEAIERFVKSKGASKQISERLRTTACPYCKAANAVGATSCVQCGAPLGSVQPGSCANCGFVNVKEAKFCANCGNKLKDEG
ncbi:MAG: zinc ribbon domain-containing protein [Chloroflexi bacterium]|nr:zinc ribbon domain-containing protein [Chloroflexota bacterium]